MIKTSAIIKYSPKIIWGIPLGGFMFSQFGLSMSIILLLIFIGMSVVDIFLRFLIEREGENVCSERLGHGIAKRTMKLILIGALIILFAHISFMLEDSRYNIIPFFILAMFVVEEAISFIENATELSGYDNKILEAIRKILGLGLDKGLAKLNKFKENKLLKNKDDIDKNNIL